MKLGILGLPNIGKTTLFNAITGSKAAAQNYAFSTVESNISAVPVPDERLGVLAEMYKPKKITPTTIEFADIAGLVRGSSRGEGLGNKFLGQIREFDALVHVVRCFDDGNVLHVEGGVDPARDVETINFELILSDFEHIERRIDRMRKLAKGDRKHEAEVTVLEGLLEHLDAGRPVRTYDMEGYSTRDLLSAKPVIYAANVSESALADPAADPYVAALHRVAQAEGAAMLPVCAQLEQDLVGLDPDERAGFLAEYGVESTGLDSLIKLSYSLLGLISFLTAGPTEVRAWPIERGTKAQQAAGKIHSDLERGFIRAEVVAYGDLVACGSEKAAKEKGLYRSEGREYVMQDGDVTLIRFNV